MTGTHVSGSIEYINTSCPCISTCWMYSTPLHAIYIQKAMFSSLLGCFAVLKNQGSNTDVFCMYQPFDDVLTSNTSKYIQIIMIGPVNSGCIGKIWMHYVCIEDVSDVFNGFILYLVCIVQVFQVCFGSEFIDNPCSLHVF